MVNPYFSIMIVILLDFLEVGTVVILCDQGHQIASSKAIIYFLLGFEQRL